MTFSNQNMKIPTTLANKPPFFLRRRLVIETFISTPLLAKAVGILETNFDFDECKLCHARIRKLKIFELSAGSSLFFRF